MYLTHTNYNDYDSSGGTLHGFMYGPRMPVFTVGHGFNAEEATSMLAFDDDIATSWAYRIPDQNMRFLIAPSGFTGMSAAGYSIAAGTETRRHYTRIYIGGRGIDGVLAAAARTEGVSQRAITGTVYEADGTTPAAGVRVHVEQVPATGAPVFLTRALSAADGTYSVHVPTDANVRLRTFRRGNVVVGPVTVNAPATAQDFTLPATGSIHVVATDPTLMAPNDRIPVRVQVLPAGASSVPSVPSSFGEPPIVSGRLHVEYATGHGASNALGEVTFRAPPGDWEVVVSRGTEYELFRQTVTVVAGATNDVTAAISRVIDTTGVMCADYHVHTNRSNDADDDAYVKLRSALSDGLEIPARSEHEYAVLTDPLIVEMGLGAWGYGLSSLELTSFELYGHFGVIPLTPSAGVNGGTEQWQTYPSATNPTAPIEFLTPPELFDNARAPRGASRDHQPPARRHQLLRLRGARQRDGAGGGPGRMGHGVPHDRGVQRQQLEGRPQRHRARLVRAAQHGPPHVRRGQQRLPRHRGLARGLPAHLPHAGHGRPTHARRRHDP